MSATMSRPTSSAVLQIHTHIHTHTHTEVQTTVFMRENRKSVCVCVCVCGCVYGCGCGCMCVCGCVRVWVCVLTRLSWRVRSPGLTVGSSPLVLGCQAGAARNGHTLPMVHACNAGVLPLFGLAWFGVLLCVHVLCHTVLGSCHMLWPREGTCACLYWFSSFADRAHVRICQT